MSDGLTVSDGQIISMEYTLRVKGEVLDSSEGGEPLEFLQGVGAIIPGLENALYGMTLNESKQVTVQPAEGYGELDEEAFADIPRQDFPEHLPLTLGTELQVQDEHGQPMYARIRAVTDEYVRLDFNHPLAGQELDFQVKIIGLRPATAEEMQHGHAHGNGHTH